MEYIGIESELALKNIQNTTIVNNIILTRTDKGNNIVTIDKTEYVNKTLEFPDPQNLLIQQINVKNWLKTILKTQAVLMKKKNTN